MAREKAARRLDHQGLPWVANSAEWADLQEKFAAFLGSLTSIQRRSFLNSITESSYDVAMGLCQGLRPEELMELAVTAEDLAVALQELQRRMHLAKTGDWLTDEELNEPKARDFFISYTLVDEDWAKWVAWILEEAGYTTVLQARDFDPGCNFVLEMQKATTQAARTVAILSREYTEGKFTRAEWATAFVKDPTGEKRILLPIRVRDCEVDGFFPTLVHIDLVGLSELAAKERLLDGVLPRVKTLRRPHFPGGRRIEVG